MRKYLDNGFIEPSNNPAERAVKPFVVQRKISKLQAHMLELDIQQKYLA